MRFSGSIIRSFAEILSALATAVSIALEIVGVKQLQVADYSVGWHLFALVAFLFFLPLVYWRVFSYKSQLDEREKRRRIADQLAKFLRDGDELQGRISVGANGISRDFLAWAQSTYEYLREHCGDRYAALFVTHNYKDPPPTVTGLESPDHERMLRQTMARTITLRTLIEEFSFKD